MSVKLYFDKGFKYLKAVMLLCPKEQRVITGCWVCRRRMLLQNKRREYFHTSGFYLVVIGLLYKA